MIGTDPIAVKEAIMVGTDLIVVTGAMTTIIEGIDHQHPMEAHREMTLSTQMGSVVTEIVVSAIMHL
jgi:hypothetical protein